MLTEMLMIGWLEKEISVVLFLLICQILQKSQVPFLKITKEWPGHMNSKMC